MSKVNQSFVVAVSVVYDLVETSDLWEGCQEREGCSVHLIWKFSGFCER